MTSGSRLIVKNLPTKITEDKLKSTFEGHGLVTDVQLKYTKDGKFRHFGFIGFKEAEDADKARKYFNGAFIGASKVTVEPCANIGDDKKPRAWSKYSQESSAFKEKLENQEKSSETSERTKKKKEKKKQKQKRVDELLEEYKDDPKFQEFLRIHKRNAEGVWNNDAILMAGQSFKENKSELSSEDHEEAQVQDQQSEPEDSDGEREKEENEEGEEEEKVAKDSKVSDLDYLKAMTVTESDNKDETVKESKEKKKKKGKPEKVKKDETYFTVKVIGLSVKTKKKDIKAFFKAYKPKSIRIPQKVKGFAYVGFATEADCKKALAQNKSFINGKQVFVKKYEKVSEKSEDSKWKEQEEGLKGEESIAESGRLFIRNLSYTVTEEDIEVLFKKYGPLTEVNLPIDRQTRKIKGFGFVTYVIPENAVKAFSELDGSTFHGRLLHLIPGKAKEDPDQDSSSMDGLNYKQKKALKEKSQAGSSHNWNTLFLGASAVADLMAEKYSVAKSDVLTSGDGNQSAAVRLALGETQIVQETRNFLEEQGISLDAFSRPPLARSKTVLLIKNLPAKTPVEEIRDLFAPHGELGRVILPPNGITAIVEFFEPTEARKAFRALAYTKFHNTPLYLEWAPDNSFNTECKRGDKSIATNPAQQLAVKEESVDEDAEPESNSTIFVKNLNFDTTEDTLREHFASAGQIHSVSIAMKKDMKKQGMMLSMGYGFLQYKTAKAADNCLKNLQHKSVDGHCLELKRSTRATSSNDEVKTTRKQTIATQQKDDATKIMVRNIPFEAKDKEVEEIFKTFGELKSVRLPKKVTGSHRGFGFIEYQTKGDARKAFEALCHSTHLYGRRLVLEWAEGEETVEDLRRKTAHQFNDGNPPAKRLKKTELMESVILAGGN